MFFMIQIIIIIYIIMVIYNIIESKKYNIYGKLITIDHISENLDDFNKHLKNLHPTIVNIKNNDLYQDIYRENLDYQFHNQNIYIKDFLNKEHISIYKDKHIIQDLQITIPLVSHYIDNSYLYPINYSLSMIKGNSMIPLQRCNHDYNIIGHINGDSIIYLFNPKHKHEIISKSLDNSYDSIKKWGTKIIMKHNDVLFIPMNWYYIQDIHNQCIQYHIDIDTCFSCIPNFFKYNI